MHVLLYLLLASLTTTPTTSLSIPHHNLFAFPNVDFALTAHADILDPSSLYTAEAGINLTVITDARSFSHVFRLWETTAGGELKQHLRLRRLRVARSQTVLIRAEQLLDIGGYGIPPIRVDEISVYITVLPSAYAILPFLITLLVALSTHSVVLSLYAGLFTTVAITHHFSLLPSAMASLKVILGVLENSQHMSIVLFCSMLSGLVSIITRGGGIHGFAETLAQNTSSSRAAQVATMAASGLIWFDDYANLLLVGSALRSVADQHLVSRERFAFIVDSCASVIVSLLPSSSWGAFEIVLLMNETRKLINRSMNLQEAGFAIDPIDAFTRMAIHMHYNLFLLLFNVLSIALERDFGPMLSGERLRKYGQTSNPIILVPPIPTSGVHVDGVLHKKKRHHRVVEEDVATYPSSETPRRWFNALVPITVLIGTTLIASSQHAATSSTPEMMAVSLSSSHGGGGGGIAEHDNTSVLLHSSLFTILFSMIWFRFQRRRLRGPPQRSPVLYSPCSRDENTRPILTVGESVGMLLIGIKEMTPACVVLVMSWALGDAVESLGTGNMFASVFATAGGPITMPGLIFLISALSAVATGSSFGAMALLFPLVSPTAYKMASISAVDVYYSCLGALVSGSIFGSHASPISDTTILASLVTRCAIDKHVITQAPYVIFVAVFAIAVSAFPGVSAFTKNIYGGVLMSWVFYVVSVPVNGKKLDVFANFANACRNGEVPRMMIRMSPASVTGASLVPSPEPSQSQQAPRRLSFSGGILPIGASLSTSHSPPTLGDGLSSNMNTDDNNHADNEASGDDHHHRE